MPVALSADLPAGTVMPAQSPAGPIALWRSRSGRAAAFADRCPHRGMNKAVADGNKFLIAGSFGYQNGALQIARRNPDVTVLHEFELAQMPDIFFS